LNLQVVKLPPGVNVLDAVEKYQASGLVYFAEPDYIAEGSANEVPGNGVDDDRNGIIDDIHGINAITGSTYPRDDHGHGTHVAGVLGALGDNGKGLAGAASGVVRMFTKSSATFAEGKHGGSGQTNACVNRSFRECAFGQSLAAQRLAGRAFSAQ